jgi:hypothetical protein
LYILIFMFLDSKREDKSVHSFPYLPLSFIFYLFSKVGFSFDKILNPLCISRPL